MSRIPYVFFVIIICCCGINPPASMYKATYSDRDVVKSKCFTCHAPYTQMGAIALNSMYSKYGYKKLKKYMNTNFSSKKKENIKEHENLILSKKEQESVLKFLISIKK